MERRLRRSSPAGSQWSEWRWFGSGSGRGNGSDEHDEDDNFEDAVDEQFGEVTECWLMPEDIHTVDTMYSAMTTCQALHPDSANSDSEDSDPMQDAGGLEDEAMEEDDALTLGRNGVQNLSLDDDEERFEDADE